MNFEANENPTGTTKRCTDTVENIDNTAKMQPIKSNGTIVTRKKQAT